MKLKEKDIIQDLKKRIFLYLKSHTRISLREVSLMSGFSVKHTQELFVRQTGITIGKYIKQCIFSKSVISLVLTRRSILDISLEAGFSSQQSFSRSFKKVFSLSPIEYRKRGIIESQKIISEFHSDGKFICDGELYLPVLKTRASFVRFTDNVLTPASVIMGKKRVQKIKSSLLQTDHIFIASHIIPIKNESQKVYIDSFFCSQQENEDEISIFNGIYYRIKFNGTFDDYIIMGRNIIFYITVPFSLDVIEEIKKDGDGFDITIFIPKKNSKN
ncbi:helix-turn-helix domain-containing protein [Escherichia coli]|nr:helix-turn-helix domain-containing protein [Escherichia coli]